MSVYLYCCDDIATGLRDSELTARAWFHAGSTTEAHATLVKVDHLTGRVWGRSCVRRERTTDRVRHAGTLPTLAEYLAAHIRANT